MKEQQPFTRSSGVLLHPVSLPGFATSGDIGQEAVRYICWLEKAGIHWWQMLPIGPVDDHGCPYHSTSSFAGNPLLISLDELAKQKLLDPDDLNYKRIKKSKRIDYKAARIARMPHLQKAFDNFVHDNGLKRDDFQKFTHDNQYWLDDYALFTAINKAHDHLPWINWPKPLKHREPDALSRVRYDLEHDYNFTRFVQFIFDQQWTQLRQLANKKGIGLIGDLPIYVTHHSADVWAHQSLFQLNQQGQSLFVSGAAPDLLSKKGQVWGHPLYDWKSHKREQFVWWSSRLKRVSELFDSVRIDHYLGLVRYWQVSAKAKTARNGKWVKGPGASFFKMIQRDHPTLQIIVEDLGILTEQASDLRDRFNLPGMRVLHYAFGNNNDYHLPHHYPKNSVAYTGTHDNDTTVGWWNALQQSDKRHDRKQRKRVLEYLGPVGNNDIHWQLIRLAMTSPANLAIVPMQDYLGLDSTARMNQPGLHKNNWRWRLTPGTLTAPLAKRIKRLTQVTGRS